MKITFSLAVFVATVFSTPLAPAADLAQSAGTLAQIDAHLLSSEGAVLLYSGAPDHLLMGQTEADGILSTIGITKETGGKQAKVYHSCERLLHSMEKNGGDDAAWDNLLVDMKAIMPTTIFGSDKDERGLEQVELVRGADNPALLYDRAEKLAWGCLGVFYDSYLLY